jgi:hypothetical protein
VTASARHAFPPVSLPESHDGRYLRSRDYNCKSNVGGISRPGISLFRFFFIITNESRGILAGVLVGATGTTSTIDSKV